MNLQPYYKEESGEIWQGDCLEVLKQMESESVDMVMTSPPYYGLRNYGVDGQIGLENTFNEFLDKMMLIFAEVKRVMKKTGSFWLNMGDCFGGSPAGNKSISEANIGTDSLYVRKMKQCEGSKRLKYWGGNVEKSTLTNPERQQEMGRSGNQKCMLMQPERMAIRMIDGLGFILRNKCYNGDVRVYLGELTSPNRRSSFRREREVEDGKGYYGTRGHHETTIRLYRSFNRDEFSEKDKEGDFMQDMLD